MNQKLTFSELVEKIADETGASRRVIHDLLLDEIRMVKEDLIRDGVAYIHGLGHFRLSWREARPGRNPQTGETIEIPAHSSVHFKAQNDLRQHINRKYEHLKPKMVKGTIQKEEDQTILGNIVESDIAPEYETLVKNDKKKKRTKFWMILFPLLFTIIISFFVIRTCSEKPRTKLSKPAVVEKEQAKPIAPSQPSEEKIRINTPGGIHTVIPGDNLWKISSSYYKQGELWPNIYRANLNQISNPDVLIPASRIRVPDLIGKPGAWTQKDIDDISTGFLEAYLYYKNKNMKNALDYLWVVRKWDATQVIAKYHNRIDANDLKSVDRIPGTPHIQ